jgi:hypothetical protein
MTEVPVLICSPYDPDRTDDVIEGSECRWCGICAAPLWVSPKGCRGVDQGKLRPLCVDCGIGLMADDPEPNLTALEPDSDTDEMTLEVFRQVAAEERIRRNT